MQVFLTRRPVGDDAHSWRAAVADTGNSTAFDRGHPRLTCGIFPHGKQMQASQLFPTAEAVGGTYEIVIDQLPTQSKPFPTPIGLGRIPAFVAHKQPDSHRVCLPCVGRCVIGRQPSRFLFIRSAYRPCGARRHAVSGF